MVKTNSTMQPLGSTAPEFQLPDYNQSLFSLNQLKGRHGTLVMFICNHCPFVVHIEKVLFEICNSYKNKGIGMVAINSNDWTNEKYTADRPEKMAELAQKYNLSFPYLCDDTQDVAKKYGAACTPDFFLYTDNLRLAYRGQFDSSRPSLNIPVTGNDLTNAMNALIDGNDVLDNQIASIGCNIKWRDGNEPDYF